MGQNTKFKKIIYSLVDFAVPAGKVRIIESEKIDKSLVFARELKKKLWNVRVTVISIMVGALGTVPKGLKMGAQKSSKL